jgi:hypothetical protein
MTSNDLITRQLLDIVQGWRGHPDGDIMPSRTLTEAATLIEHQAQLITQAREALFDLDNYTNIAIWGYREQPVAIRARSTLKALEEG